MSTRRAALTTLSGTALALAFALASPVHAQKKYDPGATDAEIKVGNIFSPFLLYCAHSASPRTSTTPQPTAPPFRWTTAPADDPHGAQQRPAAPLPATLPPPPLGTPPNSAIHRYMNQKKVPHLFVATGASKWGDPKNFPWTMGWQPDYQSEAKIYAAHILETRPNAKIGVLFANDDYGKDYLKGLKDGLGAKASQLIVKEVSYETSDPTVDSQIVTLKASGADTFFNIASPRFAAQAIKKAAEIGWKPVQYLNSVSISVGSVMTPAGLENGVGIISAGYIKDPTDPQWQKGKEWDDFTAFVKKYLPTADMKDVNLVYGYTVSQGLVQVLKQAGDNLTRENIMKQAASLDMTLPMLLPGVNVKTGPDDFYPIERMQLQRFTGKTWELFGKVYGR